MAAVDFWQNKQSEVAVIQPAGRNSREKKHPERKTAGWLQSGAKSCSSLWSDVKSHWGNIRRPKWCFQGCCEIRWWKKKLFQREGVDARNVGNKQQTRRGGGLRKSHSSQEDKLLCRSKVFSWTHLEIQQTKSNHNFLFYLWFMSKVQRLRQQVAAWGHFPWSPEFGCN